MIAFFRWIVSPCLFGHHESRVFERVNGHLVPGVSPLSERAAHPGDVMSEIEREPEYSVVPADGLNPILVNLGMDVRLELRLDMRQFLREHGLDPQSGEPSPEELQAVVIERLRTYFRSHDYMVDVHVQWITDLETP